MYRRFREIVAITLQYDMRQLVMRILIIADELSQLRPKNDTSIALAAESLQRGHQVWWSDSDKVSLRGHAPVVQAAPVRAAVLKVLPQLEAWERYPLTAFDAVLIRKNPPFNEEYIRLCWFLAPYETRLVISNRPSLLVHHHEKMIPIQAVAAGLLRSEEIIPSCVSRDAAMVADFMAEQNAPAWIMKPWTGYGGHGVRKVDSTAGVIDAVGSSDQLMIVQPFLPTIATNGDRRIFYIDGEIAADFVRLPQAGGFISNLASGGRAEFRPMDGPTRDRAERLGQFLCTVGFDFAGADLIDGYVSEVNVTSPTGLVSLLDLGGPNLVPRVLDTMLRKL